MLFVDQSYHVGILRHVRNRLHHCIFDQFSLVSVFKGRPMQSVEPSAMSHYVISDCMKALPVQETKGVPEEAVQRLPFTTFTCLLSSRRVLLLDMPIILIGSVMS